MKNKKSLALKRKRWQNKEADSTTSHSLLVYPTPYLCQIRKGRPPFIPSLGGKGGWPWRNMYPTMLTLEISRHLNNRRKKRSSSCELRLSLKIMLVSGEVTNVPVNCGKLVGGGGVVQVLHKHTDYQRARKLAVTLVWVLGNFQISWKVGGGRFSGHGG